ncbi:hypothetical protein V1477_003654 [Vespula maculifrons]|uniref:Uncharacterized protein n=1 Tax=Vespula maculifrons TaxID=7453 RepID=A0ABD2CTX7_VESMC
MEPISFCMSTSTHRRSRSTHSLDIIEKNQCNGDSGLPEMTTKSSVRPILIVNGSVLLRISKSTHRRSRSTHSLEIIEKNQCNGDSGLPEMITKSSVRTILIVNGSVLLRISKSTHRRSRSTHSLEVIEKNQCKTKLWSGDSGLPEMTTKSSVRPILIVNGSVFLRISKSTHRRSRSTHSLEVIEKNQCKTILWSGDSGLPEMTTKSSVRPTLIVNGSVLLRISKSTHRRSRSTHSLEVIEKNQCKTKLWSGDSGLPEMTTKSSVRTTLIVNGSVFLRISKSTHCRSRSTHSLEVIEKNQCKTKLWSGDSGLPEMTTKSSVRPILIVNGSVLLRISKSTHRRSRSTHSLEVIEKNQCKTKLWSGDSGFPEMTTKSSVRPILIVNGSVFLRISKSTHRRSRSTHSLEVIEKNQCKTKLWSGDSGLPEMTTKSSVRTILIVNGSVLLRISKSTHRRSRSTHSLEVIEKNQCKTKLWSGDSGLPEMTTKSSVRPILIVNGSVFLRISKSTHRRSRSMYSLENEIVEWGYSPTRDDNISDSYWCNLASNFDEYASQASQHAFSTSNREELIFKLRSEDTCLREGTTKTGLRPPLTVTGSVVFWTSTRELGKFRGGHSCKLNCEVGIVSCERGQQRRAYDRLLQLLVQLCFGLRRWNIENFAEDIPASINEQLNCEVGIVSCERGQQRRAYDRLLQLLVQLCFGLRRWNIENFAEDIPASINEQLIKYIFEFLIPTIFCTIKLRSGDNELREGRTKTGLRPTLTVTGSVVFWTSTRELRKFRGGHSCKLNCEVGILGCERGQQRRAFDRLLQLLVQLCFGLRRGNLENFAEVIPASINEQLNCEVGILGCERGQQRRAFDRLLQLLVQLCFGLRRGNLENFAEVIPASINEQLNCEVGILGCERGQQRRAFDRLLQLLVQLCFGLRRGNLENFAEVIPASINEQLRLYDFRLNCEVGILGCERGQQRRAFDRLLQLLVQLCFGLRRGNLENFAEVIPASINEQLVKYISEFLIITIFYSIELRSGDTRLREGRTKTGLRPTFILCFGLRRGNLENFAEVIPASINEQLVKYISEFLIITIFYSIELRSGDTRLRERTTKTGLRPPLTVTGSVVFWTSTKELRNFRGCHLSELKCEVGILNFERRQQSCAFDRLLQSLVQLCFGLRRGNIENFAGCLSSEYSRRVYARLKISSRVDLEIFALLVDFENLSPRRNLEIFAFPADFENLSPRVDLEIFGLPADFENLSPRVDLEIFGLPADFENLSPRKFLHSRRTENLFTSGLRNFYTPGGLKISSQVDLEIFGLPEDFENLSPRRDLEIFAFPKFLHSRRTLKISSQMDLEIFGLPEDFENLSPRRDLEIFAFPMDFHNLSPRMDLEIFTLPEDFENLFTRGLRNFWPPREL